MPGANQYRATDFIDAIPGSGGIISTIAKRVGCAWHTAKKYCVEYATVAKVYQDEIESVGDLAESILLDNLQKARRQQIERGEIVDTTDAKWYLTMKAKGRGYSSRQELDIRVEDVDAAIERELEKLVAKRQAVNAREVEGS